MRATLSWSASETIKLLPSLRFVLGSLDVRMWRTLVWCRLILPVPVLEKRLAAPVWVFNLGIVFSISAGQSITESPRPFQNHFGNRDTLIARRTKSVYRRREFTAISLAPLPGRA